MNMVNIIYGIYGLKLTFKLFDTVTLFFFCKMKELNNWFTNKCKFHECFVKLEQPNYISIQKFWHYKCKS